MTQEPSECVYISSEGVERENITRRLVTDLTTFEAESRDAETRICLDPMRETIWTLTFDRERETVIVGMVAILDQDIEATKCICIHAIAKLCRQVQER